MTHVFRASVEPLAGTASDPGWRRKPGRPRSSWLRDVLKVTHLTAQEAWTAADDRDGWRAQRSTADSRLRVLMITMMMMYCTTTTTASCFWTCCTACRTWKAFTCENMHWRHSRENVPLTFSVSDSVCIVGDDL